MVEHVGVLSRRREVRSEVFRLRFRLPKVTTKHTYLNTSHMYFRYLFKPTNSTHRMDEAIM